jgi:hypothetical protein
MTDAGPTLVPLRPANAYGDSLVCRDSASAHNHERCLAQARSDPTRCRRLRLQETLRVDLQQIVYPRDRGGHGGHGIAAPYCRWLARMIQPASVKTPTRVLAMRLELATSGVASKLLPNTTPKKPQGMALIRTT